MPNQMKNIKKIQKLEGNELVNSIKRKGCSCVGLQKEYAYRALSNLLPVIDWIYHLFVVSSNMLSQSLSR
jgi:hypothetical protein